MLKITSKGIPELQTWLKELTRGVKQKAAGWVAEYLVGDQTHGLMHYPGYKHITMKQAYGGFVSDKQRRYVMAMIKQGRIDPGYPHRTGELQRGWEYKATSRGYTITNETPYAGFVMGDIKQANMHNLIGWHRTAEVVKDNLAGAFRHASAQVKKWLAERRRR